MPAYKDDATGKWYASFKYRDWTGANKRKIKRGFATKRAALEWQRAFLDKAAGAPDMTLGALHDLYMNDCRLRLRASTCKDKETIFQRHILPYFKDKAINSISPADVRAWQNQLLNLKKGKQAEEGPPQGYAATYLKTVNIQLSALMNYAVKYYNLSKNPVTLAGSMGKAKAHTMDFWTLEEFRQFIAAVPPHSMDYAAFSVLFWTGIRRGELLALTAADFDAQAATLRINKSYTRVNGVEMITDPKTSKSRRTVDLPPFLVGILQEYIKRLYHPAPSERLFECSIYHMYRSMKKYCALSGVKEIRLHDLRHSHASLLIEMGFSPLLIKERLGHEKIETTLAVYSHLYPSRTDEMIRRLQEKGTAKTGK